MLLEHNLDIFLNKLEDKFKKIKKNFFKKGEKKWDTGTKFRIFVVNNNFRKEAKRH